MEKEKPRAQLHPEIFDEAKKRVKEEMHKEYVTFVGFLGMLIRTVNPLSYKKLCNAGFGHGLRFYFHLLCFSFMLFFLFTIPYLVHFYKDIHEQTNYLNNFTLAPQLDVNQSIEFPQFGIAVANQKTYDKELLLITQQSLYWKNGICVFSNIACLLYDEPHYLDFSQAPQIVEDRDKFANAIFFFILLMLPGILIIIFFYLSIKFFLVILLYSFFGFAYTTLIRYEVRMRQLFLIAIYSLTPTIFVETIFGLYYETYYVPYVLSFVLFVVSTYLVAEKPFHHFKH